MADLSLSGHVLDKDWQAAVALLNSLPIQDTADEELEMPAGGD